MINLTHEEAQHILKLLDKFDMFNDFTDVREPLRARLSEPEPEPVAWLITDEMINSLQVDSIQRLIDRARHAHMTDIKLRINGQDEWHQADWIKHMKRAVPQQREWVGLTNEECTFLACKSSNGPHCVAMTEAKLKEKNGF